VALLDDEIVGFSSATRNHPSHGDADIFAIYLRPDMFGSGAGQALMTETLNLIGDANVRLDVASYNGRAIRFYERNGFSIVPNSETLYKGVIPTIDMIRQMTLSDN
jgi:ribosomal protein S18 acetylase RimI-like enzyme